MAAERAVIEIELVPDLVVYGVRDANCAGLGERLEPGGDIDAIAENVVAIDDDIAKVDADPDLETALRRKRLIDRVRGTLHLDRAAEGGDDAGKSANRLSPAVPTIRPPCALKPFAFRRLSPSG